MKINCGDFGIASIELNSKQLIKSAIEIDKYKVDEFIAFLTKENLNGFVSDNDDCNDGLVKVNITTVGEKNV
jgi:hypothetical protein